MTEAKHTPGTIRWVEDAESYPPGSTDLGSFEFSDGESICSFGVDDPWESSAGTPPSELHRERMVACWNGCVGLNPEAYREVVEAGEKAAAIMRRWGLILTARRVSVPEYDALVAALAKARGKG